jgi:hypothetical protein
MRRASSKEKSRETHEWTRGLITNVGTTSSIPYEKSFTTLREKASMILPLFF